MKWFTRKAFDLIIITLLIQIVAGNILTSSHGHLSSESFFLESSDLSSMVKESDKLKLGDERRDKSNEEETSASQLMPFFYVGDTDQPDSEKSKSMNNIVPAIRQKKLLTDQEKRIVSSKSTVRQPPLTVKKLQKVKLVSNIPVLVPDSETRRVLHDNEIPFESNIHSPKPASVKFLWYIQPTSSFPSADSPSPSSSSLIQSFPLTRTSRTSSSSAFDPDFVPLFKYNSMVSKLPSTQQSKPYYSSNYQTPSSFYNHYQTIYQPKSLSFPSFSQFSTHSEDDDDDEVNIVNTGPFLTTPFSIPAPTYSTSSFSPSGLNYFGKPYGSPMRRQFRGKPIKTSPFIHASKDILKDPDIEQLLTTFDMERDIDKSIGKNEHYRPRKSYDEISQNGKYSGKSGSRSKSYDSFSDPFMGSPESNTGHYGGRSDFKPYFGYYKGFQISPYKGKGFDKVIPNERYNMNNQRNINNFNRNIKPF